HLLRVSAALPSRDRARRARPAEPAARRVRRRRRRCADADHDRVPVGVRVKFGSLVALALALGCSHMYSNPPPNRPLVDEHECSRSRGPVVGDTILAVNTGALAVLLWGVAALEYENNQSTVVPSWDTRPLTVNRGVLVTGVLSTAATAFLIYS